MNTRFGFDPTDAISGPPKPPEAPRPARTVFGRDFHLPDLTKKPDPPAGTPRGMTPPPPAHAPRGMTPPPPAARPGASDADALAVTMAPSIGAAAAAMRATDVGRAPATTPIKNSLSVPAPDDDPRRPTATPTPKNREHMARFLARRNTVGDIVPLTQKDSLLTIPRERWVKPALTVGGAALCSFIVVALVMWIANARRDKAAPAKSDNASPAAALAVPRAAAPGPAAVPPPAVPATTAAAASAPAAAPDLTPPAATVKVPASATPVAAKRAPAGARRKITAPPKPRPRKSRVGPDDPLPPTFF